MTWNFWLPLMILATSLFAGFILYLLPEHRRMTRRFVCLTASALNVLLVLTMTWAVYLGYDFETSFNILRGVDFILRTDPLAILFTILSSLLWFCTTIYAIGYMHGSPNLGRFFGFFSHCVTATLGIALAGNLFTFFLFYEILTLSTYPLVVHRGTREALRAGRNYLLYTLTGGMVLLTGVVWLHNLIGDTRFLQGGLFQNLAEPPAALTAIFILLVGGLGVKSALVPLHGWLPQAMVAPAPVSALLHAVAVVKAGAFGIVRVVYDIFGVNFAAERGLLLLLMLASIVTIIYGSLRALWQTDIKKLLAFSTISQVSYIVLGVSLFGPLGTIGGVVHLVHQGIMKVTLFFCAGNYDKELGVHHIAELDGAGRRMPWTSMTFTVAALGMIGLPPLAGFISKWYLGMGAIEAGQPIVVSVLVLSSLLNGAYFLPLVYRLWFRPQRGSWPDEQPAARFETSLWMLLPPLATGAFVIIAGLLAAMPVSPLFWARVFAVREYPL